MFKQIKGIPMGGNSSPLIADLFLANLEFRYMDKLVSSKSPENLRMAKKLSNNSRNIDDIGICNMNNNNDCSDRILTCRIKSICSPDKVGTGVIDFNYQPGS